MVYLGLFLLGALFGRYFLEWVDVFSSKISSRNALYTTKIQKQIDNIKNSSDDKQLIGFDVSSSEIVDDEEECEDIGKNYSIVKDGGKPVVGFKLNK